MSNLLALDISSKAVGWTYMRGRKQRGAGGTIWRGKENLFLFAERVRAFVWAQHMGSDRIVYEVNHLAPIARAKQKPLAICNQAIGRVLQALGVEGEPIQADNKKKPRRRIEMGLIYHRPKMSEHEADSLALAHRVISEVRA